MMDLACPKWVITGLPHRGNQALLFDRGFKVDDEARFWSAEPPGGPRALRPSEFDRHRPRPVSYPGTQPHLGQMTRKGSRQTGTWLSGESVPPMGQSACGSTHQ